MEKQYRKQLEQQLTVTIANFLRQTNEATTSAMAKQIKSAAKDLAKKFVKIKYSSKKKVDEKKMAGTAVKATIEKTKPATKIAIKAKKRRVTAKKKSAAKKSVAVKTSKK
jgi:hypothetical protein